MKRIGILSDTHSTWDDRYALHFSDCDEIWHAGDVGSIDIIERLEQVAPLRVVRGNIDSDVVARKCAEWLEFETEGVKVLLTHIGGYPGRYTAEARRNIVEKGIRLFVCGHSHILKVMFDRDLNCLHINPGAAGHHGWQKERTLVKLTLDNGDMRDLEVIELGKYSVSPDK